MVLVSADEIEANDVVIGEPMIKGPETDRVKEHFRSILERDLRHHFDRDWYDVYHGERTMREVEAFSINCIDPQCGMKLDINYALGQYVLWYRCRTIATIKFDRHMMQIQMNDKIDPITLCRKLQVMA